MKSIYCTLWVVLCVSVCLCYFCFFTHSFDVSNDQLNLWRTRTSCTVRIHILYFQCLFVLDHSHTLLHCALCMLHCYYNVALYSYAWLFSCLLTCSLIHFLFRNFDIFTIKFAVCTWVFATHRHHSEYNCRQFQSNRTNYILHFTLSAAVIFIPNCLVLWLAKSGTKHEMSCNSQRRKCLLWLWLRLNVWYLRYIKSKVRKFSADGLHSFLQILFMFEAQTFSFVYRSWKSQFSIGLLQHHYQYHHNE